MKYTLKPSDTNLNVFTLQKWFLRQPTAKVEWNVASILEAFIHV